MVVGGGFPGGGAPGPPEGTPLARVMISPAQPQEVADRPVSDGLRTPAWLAASASAPHDGARRHSDAGRIGSGGGHKPFGSGRRYSSAHPCGSNSGGSGGSGNTSSGSGATVEATWDAAIARIGSASPGGFLRRLTTPRTAMPGDYAVLDAARAESSLRETALAMGPPDGKGAADVEAAKKAAAKAEKELKKKIKDYMKTSLSSERTFFKWIWAGLNLGALGTFALVFFHDEGFPFRLIVTAVAWSMALASALYGLRQFHRRRRALLSVIDDPETWESPAAPAIVVAAFVVMMLTLIIYAIASGQQFGFRTAGIFGGSADGGSVGKE